MVTQADIDNNGNPNPDGFIHNVATGDSDDTDPQDSFTDTPSIRGLGDLLDAEDGRERPERR